jgi:hypothetical protein
VTTLWGFVVLFALPDTINNAKFLTEEEKQYAEDRVVMGGTGRVDPLNSKWKSEQAIECLLDPKTWFFAVISVLTQVYLLLKQAHASADVGRSQMEALEVSVT